MDNPSYEETLTTSATTQLVDGLQCCSDYRFSVSAFTIDYGPTAAVMMFRTNPDLSSKPLIYHTQKNGMAWAGDKAVKN